MGSLRDDVPVLSDAQKLDRENYSTWSFKIYTIFEIKQLLGFLDGTEVEPPETDILASQGYKNKAMRSRAILRLNIQDCMIPHIRACNTAAEIWKTLADSFASSTLTRAMMLRNQLNNLRRTPDQSIDSYLTRFKEIRDSLSGIGKTIPDEELTRIAMQGLDSSYDTFVMNISLKEKFPNFPKFCELLLLESQRREFLNMNNPKSKPDQALVVQTDSKKKRETGNMSNSRGENSNSKGKSPCGYCNRRGHKEARCYKKAFDEKEAASKTQGNLVEAESSKLATTTERREEELFVIGKEEDQHGWWFDSGATNHITGRRNLFASIRDLPEGSNVLTGDNSKHPIKGVGSINVTNTDGEAREITDVLHVPGITKNLISVGQIVERGLQCRFNKHGCFIEDPNDHMKILATGERKGRMFRLTTQHSHEANAARTKPNVNELWHQRLGHTNYNFIQQMANQNMVEGLPPGIKFSEKDHVCDACVRGKLSRSSFPTSQNRSSAPLEIVHSDVWGPAQLSSNGGNRYFVSFIDDFSRHMWVYFLKYKSDVFETFRIFKRERELETNTKIKTLRSDGGGEYNSKPFNELCELEGIKRQYTLAYTPQQNGVAERKNRVIVEHARAMLIGRSVPKTYWAEAIATAIYLHNISPTVALNNVTPREAYFKSKPKISHLRVFGCVCYAHIPEERRQKLDDKAVRCIFVGYSTNRKGYKCWDPRGRKIILSRDVVFDEDAGYYDESGPPLPDPTSISEDDNKETTQDDEVEDEAIPFSPRRSQRKTKPIERLRYDAHYLEDHMAFMANVQETIEPQHYGEACQKQGWNDAMKEEMDALYKNQTWELVDLPENKKKIGCKWVYKIKYNSEGKIDKYKARLVAKGYTQQSGIDYDETFSPVAKMNTIRVIIALATQNRWKLHQMDVKNAFLNGTLDEDIYMSQPEGFVDKKFPNKVCYLKKSLYGLKQAGRQWNLTLDRFFAQGNFTRSLADTTVYIKREGENIVLCVVYVDDLIISGNTEKGIEALKENLRCRFEMKDLGLLHFCLGIEIIRYPNSTFITQKKYVLDILARFNMTNSKISKTPMEQNLRFPKSEEDTPVDAQMFQRMVGSLIYLTITRPDICYVVNIISQHMHNPRECHLTAAKRILCYLNGTANLGIQYDVCTDLSLYGYTDADWAGDSESRKSTSGYCFHIGSGAISWSCKKQPTVALSSTEAEYRGLTNAACESTWLQHFFSDFGFRFPCATIYCDNQSAIKLSKNPVFHARTKHIEVHYHFVREKINEGNIKVEYCNTDMQVADVMTKPLGVEKFVFCRAKLGVCEKPVLSLRGGIENQA